MGAGSALHSDLRRGLVALGTSGKRQVGRFMLSEDEAETAIRERGLNGVADVKLGGLEPGHRRQPS